MKLTWKKCPCGHEHCKIMQPVEIGHFYQGTGFNEKDREIIDQAFRQQEMLVTLMDRLLDGTADIDDVRTLREQIG
jgi:hypothetical protein